MLIIEFLIEKIKEKNEKDKVNKLLDYLKKILKYIKSSYRIKYYKIKKTNTIITEFTIVFKDKTKDKKVSFIEMKKESKEILKFCNKLNKFNEANEKILLLIQGHKHKDKYTKHDIDEISSILKYNFTYVNLKMISKVTNFVFDMILNSSNDNLI